MSSADSTRGNSRLAEKTIEINFCAQFTKVIGRRVWWYGLTQRQESQFGFDVTTQISGWVGKFQIKASARLVSPSGNRRFQTTHRQLSALRHEATLPCDVFYVLPTVGEVDDLTRINFELLPHLRFLDLRDIPDIEPPTTKQGTPRKSGIHYMDLDPAGETVTVRSEPTEVPVRTFEWLTNRLALRSSNDAREMMRGQLTRGPVDDALDFVSRDRYRIAAFFPD